MKALCLLALCALLPLTVLARAQYLDQGVRDIGGNVAFERADGDAYKLNNGQGTSQFTANLNTLYFVRDGLALGGSLSAVNYWWGRHESYWVIGVGPRVNWHVAKLTSGSLFLDGAFLYETQTYEYDAGSFTSKSTDRRRTWEAGVGLLTELNPHVGLTTEAYFDRDIASPDYGYRYGLRIGLKTFFDD
jgi:hypothetical protein